MTTLENFLTLDDDDAIENAVDAWLDSPDAGGWDASDIRCSDDHEAARFHFEGWFETYVTDLADDEGIYDDGLDPEVWARIDALGSEFFEVILDGLTGAL